MRNKTAKSDIHVQGDPRPVRVRPAPGTKGREGRRQRLLAFRHKHLVVDGGGSLRRHTVGTPEEGRWQGWVRFPEPESP